MAAIANADETRTIYRWARSHGYWQSLPEDEKQFAEKIQILSIEIPEERKLTHISVLMGREEFERGELKVGDYIRYTPRDSSFFSEGYSSPEKDAYWSLYGCVAVLCSAEDIQCPAQYASGIYRHKDGVAVNRNGKPIVDKTRAIDLQSYLPLKNTPSIPQ